MPEAVQRTYQLAFAKLEQTGLFQDELAEALVQSWRPSATVNRYGRRWHLARMHGESKGVVVGRIGFVNEANVTTTFFDQNIGDFISEVVPSGVVVPFAVRLNDGVTVYQLRPGLVRENSFTGALEALLNASGREYQWAVHPAGRYATWEQWRSEVERITAFNIRVDRPNPHYDDDFLIEDAVEGLRTKYLKLVAAARDDDGLDAEHDLFQQALDHVTREYGRAAVKGVDTAGQESTWVKVKGALAAVASKVTLKGAGTPEVDDGLLVEVLASAGSLVSSGKPEGESDDEIL